MFELFMLLSFLGVAVWSMLASREAPAKNRFAQILENDQVRIDKVVKALLAKL